MNGLKAVFNGIFARIPGWGRKVLLYTALSLILFLLVNIIFPFKPVVRYSQLILDKDDKLLHAFLSSDDKWRMQCSEEEISPLLIRTIITKEDKWFRFHPGINPIAILRASWQNISRGERVSGASTISMQVVRLLEPRARTIPNKLLEMFRALQLEVRFSKKEILTLYLNLLPYGGNIEGIKAASYLYFGQSPQTLSPAQVVTLSIIPNNPRHLRLGINNDRILAERNAWLQRLFTEGLFTETEFRDALAEPLRVTRLQAPAEIPHFSLLLKRMFPGDPEVKSFINREIQDYVENALVTEVQRLRSQGISNASVIVLNNHNHSVVAYAGSAGFDENTFLGQVDGASAIRSPGSTLKPFLYATAIDRGLITPKTMLSDIPMNFGGYKPQNYDETFRGRLPAGQALALSLNLPAVELANRMGINLLIDKLGRGGLRWIEARKKSLGLSVILGGCGTTLTELTSLYSTLADQGIHYPVQFRRQQGRMEADTLFSPGASWLITEMLTGLKRPDLPENFESSIHLPHIAWKTGTSYGRRDAWSIGYNPEYTVGVWVGNFDGTGVPELSGSESAAPLLFRIFNLLVSSRPSGWFVQPGDLDFRLVCPETGLPPGDNCENRVMDYYLPAISPNRKCDHLKEVLTDPAGTVSYCRNCLPATGYRKDYYPNFPPELIAFYEDEHIPYKKIPPHNPLCSRVYHDDNPAITSLIHGKEYILEPNSSRQLQLACAAAADVSRVYWYINDKFYQTAKAAEKLFFTPEPGLVKISCTDDKGRNADISIRVTFL